jgi:hypothetical protein
MMGGPLVVGIDVGAGGESETTVQICQVRGERAVVLATGGWHGEDCLPQVVHFLMPYRARKHVVRVDKVGVGHNFVFRLREAGFCVDGIGAGEKASEVRDPDGVRACERYVHLKDEYYFRLRRFFLDQRITGLTDPITMKQLAGLEYEIVRSGKLRIEPKDKGFDLPSHGGASETRRGRVRGSSGIADPGLRPLMAVYSSRRRAAPGKGHFSTLH